MKVFINRRPIKGPWGGGAHFINAFYEHAPSMGVELVDDFRVSDVILLVGMDRGDTGVSILDVLSSGHKIVTRVNENDARKGTRGVDDFIEMSVRRSDGTVFVSEWIRDYYRPRLNDSGKIERSTVVVNGVDRNMFCPQTPPKSHDKIRIVTAHWSDNYLKGQDVTEYLDWFVGKHPDFEYDYIGRTKAKLLNSRLISPLHGKQLGEAISNHDVCINGTRFDPGPNSVIESIACGLPTYVHVDGGGAVELAGHDHVFRNLDELETLLLSKKFEVNRTQFSTWRESIQAYVEYLNVVLLSS